MTHCPVCGQHVPPAAEVFFEEERYVGAMECEIKLTVWYCNQGRLCNVVMAANKLDEFGDDFIDMVGQR